jgi:DNA-binding response OmpR family regulator
MDPEKGGLVNILIVEDEAPVAGFIKAALASWGHQGDTAGNGTVALQKITRGEWHLVLLDIYLPDTTADLLIPRIKASCPKLPIITLTGKADEKMEKAVRKTGITYYMSKPVPLGELKQIIDHIEEMRKSMVDPWRCPRVIDDRNRAEPGAADAAVSPSGT